MSYFRLLFFLLFIYLLACKTESPESKSIKETHGKELKLDMFRTVLYKNDSVSLNTIAKKYNYCYVVYLLDDCSTCYEKYIQWHKKMNKIGISENFTILFIISGKYVDDFLSEVNEIEPIDNSYFIVMDPNYYYTDGNSHVPQWILEQSILIDNNNKIRMVGSPFKNSESLKLFRDLVQK